MATRSLVHATETTRGAGFMPRNGRSARQFVEGQIVRLRKDRQDEDLVVVHRKKDKKR